MAVPLPTGLFTVHRTGEPDTYDVPGHASYLGGTQATRTDRRVQQVGAWSLALDPEAWPVTEADSISDGDGNTYEVHAAARRPGLGDLAHVVVDCDMTTRDTDTGSTVDAEGTVLRGV